MLILQHYHKIIVVIVFKQLLHIICFFNKIPLFLNTIFSHYILIIFTAIISADDHTINNNKQIYTNIIISPLTLSTNIQMLLISTHTHHPYFIPFHTAKKFSHTNTHILLTRKHTHNIRFHTAIITRTYITNKQK